MRLNQPLPVHLHDHTTYIKSFLTSAGSFLENEVQSLPGSCPRARESAVSMARTSRKTDQIEAGIDAVGAKNVMTEDIRDRLHVSL